MRFVGTPEGVRLGGGILEEVVHSIHVECDPSNIPDHIDVDVSHLTIGHSIHVSDLRLPEGVQVTDDPENTVAVLSAPKAEAEVAPAEAAAAEGAAPEPELIRKAKDEEGADEES